MEGKTVVKVTLEIPEELLGEIYVAVGQVLRRGYEEEHETDLAPDPEPGADDDGTGA
jgi:hypothetical protein